MLIYDPKSEWPIQHLHLTLTHQKACPTLTSDHERNLIPLPCQNSPALTSDHGRNLILSPCQNGPALTSNLLVRMAQYLYLSYSSEWPCTHIWSCKTTSYSHIRMALSPRLSFPGNWLGTSILPKNGINPYIWSSGNQSLNHTRMTMHSHLIM